MTLQPVHLFFLRKQAILLIVLWFLSPTIFNCQASATEKGNFPNYKAIEKNVAFWEKIYSQYSLTEAVIHDSEDLSKIYEVIPLFSDDLPRASHFNALFQRHSKEKYREILKKIATEKPTTSDEKRVSALFTGKDRQSELLQAAENVRSQRGQKERFLNGVIHSGRYLDEIKRIIRAYDLPEELAYLPHVESSFNYKAYSKYGAAGIWQFTRETGKQYLTIDYTLDERLDPIIATHAAARYLKNSYQTLNSWPLALTSYNYGLAGMVRAVNEEGSYEEIFKNYNAGYFKFASRNFYSEFLAAIKVVRKLEKSPNIVIDSAQSTQYFKLPGYINIKDAGRYFRISTDTIISLNPALRRSVLSGEKRIPRGYLLRLPAGKNISRLIASFPAKLYDTKQSPTLFHLVKKGDTAGSIARQHGVPLKNLLSANSLDQSGKIYLNQKLRIPKQPVSALKSRTNIPKITANPDAKKFTSGRRSPTLILLANKKQEFDLSVNQ